MGFVKFKDKVNIEKSDKVLDNEYEVLSSLQKVNSSIKGNVTADYVLAHLKKEEKEFIIDNYDNAEYAKEIIARYGKNGYYYDWDNKIQDWIKNDDGSFKEIKLTDEQKKRINKMAERVFENFMKKAHLISILNRNKGENFLVKLMGKDKQEEKPIAYTEDDRNVIERLKDRFSGEEEE